jgi:hypothetical protein
MRFFVNLAISFAIATALRWIISFNVEAPNPLLLSVIQGVAFLVFFPLISRPLYVAPNLTLKEAYRRSPQLVVLGAITMFFWVFVLLPLVLWTIFFVFE